MKSQLRHKRWVEVSQTKARRKRRMLQAEVISHAMAWTEDLETSLPLKSLAGNFSWGPLVQKPGQVFVPLFLFSHWVGWPIPVLLEYLGELEWWKTLLRCMEKGMFVHQGKNTYWRLEGQWGLKCLCPMTLGPRKWEADRNTWMGGLPSLFPVPFSHHQTHRC